MPATSDPDQTPDLPNALDTRERYHHGALREALISASETLLAERGVHGFSLREVARRSGVSPAAPAHHFGDVNGLLSAVAEAAFQGLGDALRAGNVRGGDDPVARLREQGVGYVEFALRHPGRFGLMFRDDIQPGEMLDSHARVTFALLEDAVRELLKVPAGEPLAPAQWRGLLTIWSVVHGFAHLASHGKLDAFTTGGDRQSMLRATLAPMLDVHLRAIRDGLAEGEPDDKKPA